MLALPKLNGHSSFAASIFAVVCMSACLDPGADVTPRSGTWTYVEGAEVNNTCVVDILPNAISAFNLDHDEGDEFDIELGQNDATCDIDNKEFECAEYEVSRTELDLIDAVVYIKVRWSGEFMTDSVAAGNEVATATCVGEDCTTVPGLPCGRDVTFTAEFQG